MDDLNMACLELRVIFIGVSSYIMLLNGFGLLCSLSMWRDNKITPRDEGLFCLINAYFTSYESVTSTTKSRRPSGSWTLLI
jgi:hypothetical protein